MADKIADMKIIFKLPEATEPRRWGGKQRLEINDYVRITGLKTSPELNGQIAQIKEHIESDDRWRVILDNDEHEKIMSDNLQLACLGCSIVLTKK